MLRIEKKVADAMVVLNCWTYFQQQMQQAQNPQQLIDGLERTKEEAKRNHKEQMQVVHPDKESGNEEKAKQLNAAWDEIKKVHIHLPPPPPVFIVHYDSFTTSYTSTGWSTGTGGFF